MRTKDALIEAARRWFRFGAFYGTLETAWTGLGYATYYRNAVRAGYMEKATTVEPRCMAWWKLTPKGAEVVSAWLDCGLKLEHFHFFDLSTEGHRIIGDWKPTK